MGGCDHFLLYNGTKTIKNPEFTFLNYVFFTGGFPSQNLLKVTLKILSNKECEDHFNTEKLLPHGIDESLLCALGHIHPTHDTCQVSIGLDIFY